MHVFKHLYDFSNRNSSALEWIRKPKFNVDLDVLLVGQIVDICMIYFSYFLFVTNVHDVYLFISILGGPLLPVAMKFQVGNYIQNLWDIILSESGSDSNPSSVYNGAVEIGLSPLHITWFVVVTFSIMKSLVWVCFLCQLYTCTFICHSIQIISSPQFKKWNKNALIRYCMYTP